MQFRYTDLSNFFCTKILDLESFGGINRYDKLLFVWHVRQSRGIKLIINSTFRNTGYRYILTGTIFMYETGQ